MTLDDAQLSNVIADVGETLRLLLQDQIDLVREGEHVVLKSPAEVAVTTEMQLGLFLYQVLEMPEMRNYPPEPINSTAVRRYQTVELYYLVTPYTEHIDDSQRLLGRVMQVFFEHGIIQGSVLQGSLAGIGQELRVLLSPMSLEEVNRLWSLFPNKPYRLSVAYQVTPVRIFAGPTDLPGRVITRELHSTQRSERR